MSHAIIGQRAVGASHKRIRKECQDALRSIDFKDGTIILAIADGHGSSSCPYSADGSKQAVMAFLKVMGNLYDNYRDDHQQLRTYLHREGDTRIAQEICCIWKEKILNVHNQYKRPIPTNSEGNPDELAIIKEYGSTLLGMLITEDFLFAFQIGDGDIAFVNENGFSKVLEGDKILGVETHSLSKPDAWKKAITVVSPWNSTGEMPSAIILTTDGFANSFKTEADYEKTCVEYFNMLNKYGPTVIKNNLRSWLSETSEEGCGDDISMMILYYYLKDTVFSQVPKDGEK